MKYIINTFILFFSINCYAQTSDKIELLHADKLSNGPEGSDYWICSGNVAFTHNNTIVNCDYSHHYMRENKMIAFDNVSINKGDSLIVKGKKLFYDGNKNTAHLSGGVLLKDKHTELQTDEVFFNLESNIAHYTSQGIISEKDLTLSSERGKYDTKSHMFYFKSNVKVNSKKYSVETDTLNYNSINKTSYFLGPTYIFSENNTIYCENGWYNNITNKSQFRENAYITNGKQLVKGDSLFYNRDKSYGKAINNISMVDTLNKIIVNGNLAEYFEDESTVEVTKNALLNLIMEKDTLFITAQKFISFSGKSEYITASPEVKIYKKDFQGICDSLYYSISDSLVELFYQPVLWAADEMQISADSIQINIHKQKIESMNFYPYPIIISEADSLHYNQIKGKYMTAWFTKNKLNKLDIFGNGQSLFLIEDEKTKEKIGINKAICTDISIYLNEGKLSTINYKTIPTSTTIPYQDITESDKYLEGFNWRLTEKPKSKNDIIQQ